MMINAITKQVFVLDFLYIQGMIIDMSFEFPSPEEDAKKLGEQLKKKSFTERVFSEFQTRETTIPRSENGEGEETTEIKRREVRIY